MRLQGASYFVTFRLEGTLPQSVLQQYRAEREALLKLAQETNVGSETSTVNRQRLDELFSERIEAYLDAGRGECWLRDARIADWVVRALNVFDGKRYVLGPWVVMPNHVHAVVRPAGAQLLDSIVRSWKGFTAREANRILNRTGEPFWAREYYDQVIRSDNDRATIADYIYDNPVKAGLCSRWEDWPWCSLWRGRDG